MTGHLHNKRMAAILEELTLKGSTAENLLTCYEALVRERMLPAKVLDLLGAWVQDYLSVNRR